MTFYMYLFAELISVIFMYFCWINKKKYFADKSIIYLKRSRIFFALAFTPFCILLLLRHVSVGSDFYNYARMYLKIGQNLLSIREQSWLGVGFRFYCNFMNLLIGDNYLIAFGIFNNITLYLFFKSIYDNSSIMWLSLLVFYCFCLHFQIFNQFRQMFAIALTFYNYKYLKCRNFKKYIVICIIAGLIHNTAFLMIPFYFLSNIKLNLKTMFMYICIALLFYFGFTYIEKILSSTYYGAMYFGSKYDIESSSTILNFFVRIALLFVSMLFYKKVIIKDANNNYLYNLVIFCTLFQVLAMKSYIFARLTTYFFVYYILLIPELLSIIKNYYSKKIISISIIVLFFMYQYVYYNSSSGAVSGGYDKYYFYWENVESRRSI